MTNTLTLHFFKPIKYIFYKIMQLNICPTMDLNITIPKKYDYDEAKKA